MRKSFACLDDALIERVFQPASDVITERVGFGRVTAACFCIDVASLAWIVSRLRGLTDAVDGWEASAAFCNLTILVLGLLAMISLRMVFRRTGGRTVNPLRLAMQPYRAVVLMMLAARLVQLQPPNLADGADIAMLLSATSALYLSACVERPPIGRALQSLMPTR